MAVTATYTVRDAVTEAMREAGLLDIGDDAAAEDAAHALRHLNRMLKGWQASEGLDWAITGTSIAATTVAAHTMTPARPVRILNIRWRNTSGTDLPMQQVSRAEYDRLPNKAATGVPTQFYADRQKEATTIYVWPVPASVTTETFRITYERELEDIASLSDTLDVPSEWWDAVVTGLAARLHRHYLGGSQALEATAADTLTRAALGQNRGSIFFVGDEHVY